LAEDADANPVGGADVSTVVNAGLGTEYDYSVITSEEAALPDDFVTAVNTALGEGFFEGIEGRAWLWLPTSGQTYDIKGHKDRFGGDLTEDVTAPSTLETIVLRQTTITPNTYARERDSHITLTVTGRSVVGTTDAARSATIKYFREPVNNALSLTDGIAADTTAFDDAYDDANALTANKMDTMPFVKDGASKDTRSIFKETIPANQNARYWVLAAYTVDGDTVYDVTHYDVKNIFTTAPVWMDGYDENPTGDISVRVDEFARELLIPVDGSAALKTAIPFDLAETMPHKDDFDTRGEYDWGGSALEVVDLSGLSTEYTNAGLAYDEIDLYPIAYQKNLYAWEYSYVQNEMPKLWGAAASGDKFPTVKLDGDFIDTSKNTYCNNNDPQHYIAWLIKGEAYKKIWAEFVNVNGQPVTIDTKTGMDILVPINEGYVTDATVVPGGPDDWVVSGAPNDGDFHGTWDSGRFRGVGGAIKPPRDTVVPHGWYVANTAITNVDLTDTNTDQTGTSGFVPRYDFYQIDPKLHVDSISESGGYYSLTGGDRFYIVYDIPIPVEVITNHRSAVGTGDPLGFTPTFTPITTNDYEFEAYGAADFMHSYVAVGVEAYYLTDKTQADDLTNRTYLPYTITGDDVLAAEKIGTHTGRVDPTFVGAPWESQDAFFGIKIENSKLYTLTNQIIYVNFYYAPAGGDGIPTDESVTVTVRWRSAAVDGTILRTLLFDGRAGAEIYVPNDLPFTYDADLEKDVADMSYVKYGGAVNTADLGDDAHILTDADGHKWDWVDTHVGAAESILPYASDVLERTSGTKDEDYIFFDYEQETYAVTVEDGDGDGDFAGGAAVSVTADAAPSGKVFDKWTSDDGVVFDDENSESTTFTMLDNAVTVTATYKDPPSSYVPATPSKPKPEPEPDFRFIDVAESDWFHGDVYYVFDNGLMVGTGADTFSPNEPMTRGMLVTVLGRLHGVDVAERAGDAAPYDDVDPEMYYAPYIAWAAENGIVLGVGENRFEPDRAIKREELAALFARYTASMDNQDESVLEVFSDNAKISDYARAPMAWAVGRALIIGMGDGTVKPAGYATRAQVAAVLHRFAVMDS
ncbi:MAG: S-layer homology domain-containing protein, partial [Oscillospiraceae bacterium]|nr:S-layer homology domain-containing protein [Oscillospiraceae bacterium]